MNPMALTADIDEKRREALLTRSDFAIVSRAWPACVSNSPP
jgi:hypothetical protein